jgi:hypothetical protein
MIFAGKNKMSRTENKEYMLNLVQQFHESGISQAEFSKSKGIHLLKFRYWLQKSKEYQVKESPFVELTGQISQNISLRYPNGVMINLPSQTPVELIKSLIYL